MSPTLLSQRLKELEAAGVIKRQPALSEKGSFEYQLTLAGQDLRGVVEAMGFWGQRWIETNSSLKKKNLDVSLLMWDMRRNLKPSPLPKKRTVINFLYPELPASKRS